MTATALSVLLVLATMFPVLAWLLTLPLAAAIGAGAYAIIATNL